MSVLLLLQKEQSRREPAAAVKLPTLDVEVLLPPLHTTSFVADNFQTFRGWQDDEEK